MYTEVTREFQNLQPHLSHPVTITWFELSSGRTKHRNVNNLPTEKEFPSEKKRLVFTITWAAGSGKRKEFAVR